MEDVTKAGAADLERPRAAFGTNAVAEVAKLVKSAVAAAVANFILTEEKGFVCKLSCLN